MTLPVYVSKRNHYELVEAPDDKETMLQAILVALLACLVWGGPFGGDAGGGGGTLIYDREDVTHHLEGTMDTQVMANITDDELRYHYFQSHDFDGNKALDGMEMLKAVLHASPEKASSSEPAEENSDGGAGQDSGDTSIPPTAQFYIGEAEENSDGGAGQDSGDTSIPPTAQFYIGEAEENSDAGAGQDSGDTRIPPTAQFYIDVIDQVLSEGDLNKDGFLSYPEYVLSNERAIQRQQEQDMQDQL